MGLPSWSNVKAGRSHIAQVRRKILSVSMRHSIVANGAMH
jgi:hypothetical protein